MVKKGKLYQCAYCDKQFFQRSNFIVHFRKHTGEKPFQCDDCKRKFSFKQKLEIHKCTHNWNKSYSCNYCNTTFHTKSNFLTHRRIHLEENVYECDYCKKIFFSKPTLVVHLRGHTREKPYKCNLCKKAFSLETSLSKHKETKHTVNTLLPISHCYKDFNLKKDVRTKNKCSIHKNSLLIKENTLKQDLKHNGRLPPLFIDSSHYISVTHFMERVSILANTCVSFKPLEACGVCCKIFDITQVTIILSPPLRMKVTCSNCKLVVYTIIS